jgi:hypothetical protein
LHRAGFTNFVTILTGVVNIKMVMRMLDHGNPDVTFTQFGYQLVNERGFSGVAASCADADNR